MIYKRYRTVRLLGQGAFGKIVEAVDVVSQRRVAIKIIRAIPKYRDASKIEVRVLQRLKERDPTNKLLYDFLKENVFQAFPRRHKKQERKKVAVKKFRVILNEEEKTVRAFRRELLIWGELEHNVLPLLGIMMMEGFPCMVSEWMENGTMNAYLKAHTDTNVLELVRGIASGLAYLHSRGVVHSDLKGDNVLISSDGRAVLSDFGTSRLLMNSITIEGTQSFRGSGRWTAPEMFEPVEHDADHLLHTRASDVWAFGMVIYEALSREIPYYAYRGEGQVLSLISRGELPSKPDNVSATVDGSILLWNCCQRCWTHDSTKRPSSRWILEKLQASQRTASVVALRTKERWDLPLTGTRSKRRERKFAAKHSLLSPSGRLLVMITSDPHAMSFVEPASMSQHRAVVNIDFEIIHVAWPTMEDQLVGSCGDGILRKWTNIYDSPTLVAQSTQRHEYSKLDFSPGDNFIISTFGLTLKLWDALDLFVVWENSGYSYLTIFHPLGHRLFYNGRLSVYGTNIESLSRITTTEYKLDCIVFRLSFHPSGEVCVADTDQGVKILNGETFKETASLPYHDCLAMRYTPDGKYILLVLESRDVVLWDVAIGEAVEELPLNAVFSRFSSVEIARTCRTFQIVDIDRTFVIQLATTYF